MPQQTQVIDRCRADFIAVGHRLHPDGHGRSVMSFSNCCSGAVNSAIAASSACARQNLCTIRVNLNAASALIHHDLAADQIQRLNTVGAFVQIIEMRASRTNCSMPVFTGCSRGRRTPAATGW